MGSRLDTAYQPKPLTKDDLDSFFSPFDLKRLESYANNMLDYHVILDLVPRLALLYFTERLKYSEGIQASILLAVGLQRKNLASIEQELSLPSSQLLAMFIKIMRKMSAHLNSLVSGAIEAKLPTREAIGVSRADADGAFDDEVIDDQFEPLETGLDEELEEGGDEAMKELRAKQRELIDALPLDRYEIEEGAPGWVDAEAQVKKATKSGHKNPVVSVKSAKTKRKPSESAAEIYAQEMGGDKAHKKSKKGSKDHS